MVMEVFHHSHTTWCIPPLLETFVFLESEALHVILNIDLGGVDLIVVVLQLDSSRVADRDDLATGEETVGVDLQE
ncbi:unnamed protein product [Sphenostylis stenocarpa]|uniref:Uncharacterized protein n=1 Tax=Sphenostylis stenocarpa TaxID=92480 RepID=A0AA86RPL8_9FABA|nr:unnamed protein product [Sphenostylis stenocarpa]